MDDIKRNLSIFFIIALIACISFAMNPLNKKEATRVSEIQLEALGKAFVQDMKGETDFLKDCVKSIKKELSKKDPDWKYIEEYLDYIYITSDFIDENMLEYENNLSDTQLIIDEYKERFYKEK